LDPQGRTIWIVDAHGYGKRFIVRAEEKLTAFMELQRAIHEFAVMEKGYKRGNHLRPTGRECDRS
jgi:hypothetical protein